MMQAESVEEMLSGRKPPRKGCVRVRPVRSRRAHSGNAKGQKRMQLARVGELVYKGPRCQLGGWGLMPLCGSLSAQPWSELVE
jgi:hypothetical protein